MTESKELTPEDFKDFQIFTHDGYHCDFTMDSVIHEGNGVYNITVKNVITSDFVPAYSEEQLEGMKLNINK